MTRRISNNAAARQFVHVATLPLGLETRNLFLFLSSVGNPSVRPSSEQVPLGYTPSDCTAHLLEVPIRMAAYVR
jgi:hypothetical protein